MKKINNIGFVILIAGIVSCNVGGNESAKDNKLEGNRSFTMEDALYQVSEQQFNTSSIEQIEIKGNEGTILKIPANSLVDEKTGELYEGECTVELQEYYTLSDMLLRGLNTQTVDGQLLSSGGMVYIEILDSNEQCLVMREDRAYEIQFPKQEKTSELDMNLFYGNSNNEGQIEWEESDQSLEFSGLELAGLVDSIEIVSYEGTVDYFIFNGTDFGWMNCDAFVNLWDKKQICKLTINDKIESYHRIIDQKTMSIGVLYQERTEKGYEFSKLQRGRDYWLLSMNTDGTDYYYDLKEIKPTEKINEVSPTYAKVDLETLKEKLSELN